MPLMTPGRLLKSAALPQSATAVSFAYTDIETRCDDLLLAAQEQARNLILDAETQAEQLRQDAQQMGHATGMLQAESEFDAVVEAEVQRQVRERLQQLVPALQTATSQLIRDREQILLHWESAVVRLSITLAESILRRELQSAPSAPRALIAEALQLVTGSTPLVLRLHPDDVSELEANSSDWAELLAIPGGLRVVSDAAISRGGCLLETSAGEIDGRIETQLARVTSELLGQVTDDLSRH